MMHSFDMCESSIQKIIRAVNSFGVDGVIARKRTGRTPSFTTKQKEQIIDEFEEPG